MKSQQFNQFRIGKLPKVQCMGSRFTLQGWVRRTLPCRGFLSLITTQIKENR
jgi:hypothetical protein